MSPTDWLLTGIVFLLVVLSAMLAIAETSMTRISKVKAMALADDKRRGAGLLTNLLEHPEYGKTICELLIELVKVGPAAGIMLVVWIAVELGFLRAYAWLQPVYLVIGAAVVGLAWLVRPRPPRRKPVRRDHAQPPGTRVDVLGRW